LKVKNDDDDDDDDDDNDDDDQMWTCPEILIRTLYNFRSLSKRIYSVQVYGKNNEFLKFSFI